MATEINCPACGTLLEIDDPTREVTCPSCGRVITPEMISRLLEPLPNIPDPYGGSFAESVPPPPETIDVTPLETSSSSGASAYRLPESGGAEVFPPPPVMSEPEVLPPPALPPARTTNRTPWVIGGIVAVIVLCLACACLAVTMLFPFFQITGFN